MADELLYCRLMSFTVVLFTILTAEMCYYLRDEVVVWSYGR